MSHPTHPFCRGHEKSSHCQKTTKLLENSMAKMTARNKMMDYLATRDHSERELRRKLRKNFENPEIDKAIQFAKDNKWLPKTEAEIMALSERTASTLSRKKKGIQYINSYLQELGLPEVRPDSEQELAKAQQLVKNKFRFNPEMNREEKLKWQGKLARFLQSRGFTHSTIREVIKYVQHTP